MRKNFVRREGAKGNADLLLFRANLVAVKSNTQEYLTSDSLIESEGIFHANPHIFTLGQIVMGTGQRMGDF